LKKPEKLSKNLKNSQKSYHKKGMLINDVVRASIHDKGGGQEVLKYHDVDESPKKEEGSLKNPNYRVT
jgi:hypothetical protein